MNNIEEALGKPGIVVDRWILRLGKNAEEAGKFAPWFLPSSTFKQDLEGFLGCLSLVKLHEAVKERMSTQAKGVREAKKLQRQAQKALDKAEAKAKRAQEKAQLKLDRAAEKERIKADAKRAREEAKYAKNNQTVQKLQEVPRVDQAEVQMPAMLRQVGDTESGQVEVLKLTPADTKVFVEAVLNPPESNEALRVAAKGYEERVERKPYVIPEEGRWL